MADYKSRAPTVGEAVAILLWPSATREWRQNNLTLWASMGADVVTIKAKFLAKWKGGKK